MIVSFAGGMLLNCGPEDVERNEKEEFRLRNPFCTKETKVPSKSLLVAGGSAGAALILLLALADGGTAVNRARSGAVKPWNDKAFQAKYVGIQLKEVDRFAARLTLTYDLENMTNADYHLAEGPGLVIARKLASGGRLSQEEPARLSYPVFLPARQSARIAIEITQPFAWPAEDDPGYETKLREFVKGRLANAAEFVVYDEASRCQLELPSAWQDLQDTAQASY
jgi:hypothetical protein